MALSLGEVFDQFEHQFDYELLTVLGEGQNGACVASDGPCVGGSGTITHVRTALRHQLAPPEMIRIGHLQHLQHLQGADSAGVAGMDYRQSQVV